MRKSERFQFWDELFQKAAPTRIRKELMVSTLVYKLQEQVYGGITPQLRRLDHIAGALGRNQDTAVANIARAKPGTRLIRSWQGKTSQEI
jgi:hypothetical protein